MSELRGRIVTVMIAACLLFAVLASMPVPRAAADGAFNTEVVVHDNHGQWSQTEPSIAVDGNGTANIVWLEDGNVMFSKTTDAGALFTSPLRIGESAHKPIVEMDGNGHIFVNTGNGFFKSVDGGKTFTQTLFFSGGTGPGFGRSMTTDGDNMYVAYSVRNKAVFTDSISLIKSPDGGSSFGTPIGISAGDYNMYPSIASYGDDVYIVWGSGGNSGRYVACSRSLDSGETFTPPQQISDIDIWLTDTGKALSVGPNGELYVVWFSRIDYKVFISKSTDGGQSFNLPININDVNTTGSNPSVAVDKDGHVHVVWTGHVGGTTAIYYDVSTDGGETFGTDIKLNTGSAPILFHDSTPSIGVANNDGIYAVWQAQRYWSGLDTIFDVYFTTTNNPVFPVTLNQPAGITAGSMNLTWSQSTGPDFGRYELHMTTHAGFTISGSTLIASLADETITNHAVTDLAEDTTYYFKVRLHSSDGPYTDSNEVFATTADVPPTPVMLHEPTDITNCSMVLTWSRNANTDFARYELHMSEDANFIIDTSTLVATITDQNATTYNVTGLAEDETYYFKVRVSDAGGSHTDSNEVSGKTLENEKEAAAVQKDFLSMLGDNYPVFIFVLLIIVAAMVAIRYYVRRGKSKNTTERPDRNVILK